jgi:hypothetical protein
MASNSTTSSTSTSDNNNDWKYVGRTKPSKGAVLAPAPVKTQAGKWGGSALRKPEPPTTAPKTLDEEFPTLGKPSIPKALTASAVSTASTASAASAASTASATLSMAERMRRKLAEEEEERRKKEADEAQKSLETDEERTRNLQCIPLHSMLSKRLAEFRGDYAEYADDYPHHDYDSDHEDHYEDNGYCDAHEYDDDGWREA